MDVGGQLHAPAALSPGKARGTNWLRGWVDHKDGLEAAVKRKIIAPSGNRTAVV
jgi:hypothetical protein